MLKNIISFLFFFIIIAVVVAWALSGAPSEVARRSSLFTNPFDFLTEDPETGLPVPYYPAPPYVGIELPFSEVNGEILISDDRFPSDPANLSAALVHAEEEYDRLRSALSDARTLGDPSPLRGTVRIVDVSAGPLSLGTSPAEEYVRLEAGLGATGPVSLAGWSLQSALTGTRVPLPHATAVFRVGRVPLLSPVSLSPGDTATIVSGYSPVGTSFRENSCTGYLEQFQSFSPSLDTSSCPRGSDELPATLDNLRMYGESCVSFVSTLPHCRMYTEPFPSDITPPCATFVRHALTYNGCVSQHEWRPSFAQSSWRLFLGQPRTLWRPQHDVIRLLDSSGRTVDVWSY